MQEAIELLLNYARGVWIKRWIIVVVAWLVCLVGWAFVLKMPDQYQSEAKVYVDTDSLLAPILRGLTIQTNAAQQVQLMVKTLFTRPNLEKIARLADLDIRANTSEQFDAIIERLRSNLRLNKAGRDNIYTIRYQSNDPQSARDIVQATLTSLVENTLGDKREDTNTAADFLDRQIEDYERRLVEMENTLKEFKKQNYELLSTGGDFYSRMERLKGSISSIELELKEAKARRNSIKKQLDGEVPTFGMMEEALVTQRYEMSSSFDSRIASLQNQLDQLRLRFTDAHPDIKETQRVLDDLVEKRDTELEERRNALAGVENRRRSIDENPVYQELKLALAREDTSVQSLTVRLEDQRRQFETLQLKINTIPEIEAELKDLNRGYSVTQQKYTELLSRRESARLSQQAEISADTFQFRVIDPPRVPTEPIGPKRPLFLTMVLAVGVGGGLGLAFLVSQLRPVFLSARQLSAVTGRPVLGAVSVIPELRDEKKHKRKHWNTVLMLVLLSVFGALMILQLFPDLNDSLISKLPDIPTFTDGLLQKFKSVIVKLLNVFQG